MTSGVVICNGTSRYITAGASGRIRYPLEVIEEVGYHRRGWKVEECWLVELLPSSVLKLVESKSSLWCCELVETKAGSENVRSELW